MPRNKSNILVCRFSALGDIAMTIPTVYNACREYPEKRFFFLTCHHPSALFINAPENLTVIAVDLDNYKGIRGMWRLASSLKLRYGIDYMIDLHSVVRTGFLQLFFGLRGVGSTRIHKGLKSKQRLTRRLNKLLLPLTPTTRRYDQAFRRAGFPAKDTFRSIFQNNPDGHGDSSSFKSITTPKRIGEKWIAIAPFAKHKGKIYPLELMRKVVEHLDSLPSHRIFIFGFGNKESEEIDRLADGLHNVVNMARENIGIPGELSLMSHCDVMLSMDSFNMHLASLTGLRTVSVWGATHPYTGFLGRGQDPEDTVQLDMTCRPCSVFGDKPCFRGDYHCLWGITPQIIVQKLQTPSDKP